MGLSVPRLFVVGTAALLIFAGLVGVQQASWNRFLGRSLEHSKARVTPWTEAYRLTWRGVS